MRVVTVYEVKREMIYPLLVHVVCKGNQIKANEVQMK